MKIVTPQEHLKRGLAIVNQAVGGKNSLPVLGNVLLASDGGRLKLAATNLEVGITHWIGAEVKEEGAVTVPAKLLIDVVGGMPSGTLTLTLDPRTQALKVECGRFTSNIKGIEADEFPTIPAVAGQAPSVALRADVLREAIGQVAFAAAGDDTRPVLAGVLLRLRDRQVFLAATDGFRLAARTLTLPEPVAKAGSHIVPARALGVVGTVAGSLEGALSLTVTPGGGMLIFRGDTIEVVTRLIEGAFPDVERIIPRKYATRTVLETSELAKAVKLASYFAASSQNAVKLTIEPGGELGPGRLVLSANAAEVGDNRGELDGVVTGEGGSIALNVRYLSELLGGVKTPQIALETQTPSSPGVFRPAGQDGSVHIIMPMSIR